MAVFRRRLVFWLLKAYLKKWGRVFVISFVLGLIIFIGVIFFLQNYSHLLPQRKEVIGVVGAYELDSLPQSILANFSRGLTKIDAAGKVLPDVASSWEIKDNGKTYVFKLHDNLNFAEGRKVTSKDIQYEFKDVRVERPDNNTIIFYLQEAYSPFLVTVSRPIFLKGLEGISQNKITDIEINGTFVASLDAITTQEEIKKSFSYIFYPNQEALKTAFLLGEITKVEGLQDVIYQNTEFSDHKNTNVTKEVNYNQLVTLFYNTKDSNLSDPNLRRALSYAIPNTFLHGERAYLPYPQTSQYYNPQAIEGGQDLDHAGALIRASLGEKTNVTFVMKTLSRYTETAEAIAKEWKKVGVTIKIEEVDSVPDTFQLYLGDFNVPKDPDQYTLWHSTSPSNITKIDDKRLDKLMEDGRNSTDEIERRRFYADFQKFLLDEAPASFLYFPTSYTVTRK